jgi:hypothetical protein
VPAQTSIIERKLRIIIIIIPIIRIPEPEP